MQYRYHNLEKEIIEVVQDNFNDVSKENLVSTMGTPWTTLGAQIKKSAYLLHIVRTKDTEDRILYNKDGVDLPLILDIEECTKVKEYILSFMYENKTSKIRFAHVLTWCNDNGIHPPSKGTFDVNKSELKKRYFEYLSYDND